MELPAQRPQRLHLRHRGEELGFVGACGLLALFGVFAYTGMRIAKRSVDPFLRLLTATTTTWVIGQVCINVGYVIGLLPVTGIQLPLISAGGTSTATTLFMVGLMANAARHEPAAVAALRSGRDDRVNRLLVCRCPSRTCPAGWTHCATGFGPEPAAKAEQTRQARKARQGGEARQGRENAQARPETSRIGCQSGDAARAGTGRASWRRLAAEACRWGAGPRRASAAGSGRPRRSRPMEGQRYG